MNRKDREVCGADITDILDRCDTLRIGLINGKGVYVVPVSFGTEVKDNVLTIYFHCAKYGLKIDCSNAHSEVGFEADIFYKTEPVGMSITARYESVIGSGTIVEASEEEKIHGLNKILEHYHYHDFPIENCKSLPRTAVYKIIVSEITGKRNLPQN